MKRSQVKSELISSLGALLTKGQDGKIATTSDFGNFSCSVENFDQFSIVTRAFETQSDGLTIPFSCEDPGLQMIFSLNGRSFFNDKFSPLEMSPLSHSI